MQSFIIYQYFPSSNYYAVQYATIVYNIYEFYGALFFNCAISE